jgi:hypothetical protein
MLHNTEGLPGPIMVNKLGSCYAFDGVARQVSQLHMLQVKRLKIIAINRCALGRKGWLSLVSVAALPG